MGLCEPWGLYFQSSATYISHLNLVPQSWFILHIVLATMHVLCMYTSMFTYMYPKQKQPGCKKVRGQSEAIINHQKLIPEHL